MKQLPENIIKCNFFKLSYVSQIQIYELYLNDLKSSEFYDDFKKIFERYMKVINRFVSFKSKFFEYGEDDRHKLSFILEKCRVKINPNNVINLSDDVFQYDFQFYSNNICDDFVKKYIYDSFSYSKERRFSIALEFLNCYSKLGKFDFEEVLKLCDGNRDLFNNEIKNLSGDFYSLYRTMNTVDRMKYIWYLSHLDLLTVDISKYRECFDYNEVFSGDNKFLRPLHLGSKESDKKNKILAKYFKINY